MVKKKGLTLLELLISISLLGLIMMATSSIFSTAINNYRVSFSQSTLQKEINFVVDDISRNVKQAIKFPESYNAFTRSGTTLILALPAIGANQNFIYSGSSVEKDYIIYQLRSGVLEKRTFAHPLSTRDQNNAVKPVLENVSTATFLFNAPLNTRVETEIVLKKVVSNTEITIIGKNSAVRRNEE